MAVDETLVDQFASAIGDVLNRHYVKGRFFELLTGELTAAVVNVLEPLEHEQGATIFDGISEAIPKTPRGRAS